MTVDHRAIRELLAYAGFVPRVGVEVTDLDDGVGVHELATDTLIVVHDPDGFARALEDEPCRRR